LFEEQEATVYKDDKVYLKANRINDLYRYIEQSEGCALSAKSVNWHSRFGHPCEAKLKVLKRLYPLIPFVHPTHCETCVMAKQRQSPYKSSTNDPAKAPLELIHTDICESKCVGFDESRYF